MTTNLKAQNKVEAISTINQAVILANLPCSIQDIYFNLGKLEAVNLHLLPSVNWNDLRYIVKNLDISEFYYQVGEDRTNLVTQWDSSTQHLTISPNEDTELSNSPTNINQEGTDIREQVAISVDNSELAKDAEPSNLTEASSNSDKAQVVEVAELTTPISTNKSLNIYVARTNSEGLTQKILIDDMFPLELLSIIKPWLIAIDKITDFKKELRETKHNSIVLYLNPSYEWEIREIVREKEVTLLDSFLEDTEKIREMLGFEPFSDELFQHLKNVEKWGKNELIQAHAIKGSVECGGDFHLKTTTKQETTFKPFKREVASAYVSRITNRKGSVEERSRRESIPELGSLSEISPILLEKIYLAQSYILFNPSTLEHERVVRRIAIQKGGKFYYYSDLSKEERDSHNIEPTLYSPNLTKEEKEIEIERKKIGGKEIFPDLSIQKVTFESLDTDGNTLKVQSYQKTSGIWINSDSVETTENLVKDPNGYPVAELRYVATPATYIGFQHPNIKVKESFRDEDGHFAISSTTQPKSSKKAKLSNLSNARLVAQNSLTWMGFLSNVPCVVNLVNSHDHWQLEALPIRDIPSYPLLYCLANKSIEGYWQEEDLHNQIISPLDKEMERLGDLANKTQDPIKLEKIGRRETNLQNLRASVLGRKKLDAKVLSECTEIVKRAVSEASYKPSITDKYYSRYILAQVYFMSTNESEITYLLDDHMSHKRQATQVISAVQWLKRVPNNLQKEFPKQKPTTEQLRKYLCDKFNGKFREVELKVREDKGKTLLDIIYLNKVQITQLLTIKMPASDGKNRGKVSTKVATTLNFSSRNAFEKFLRTKDGRFVAEAQNQLRHLVNIFLSRNFNTLVGEGKVGHQRKVSEIIGFERSTKGWSEIKKGFVKHLVPYSANSEVNAGKLVYLATNQVLSSQDLEHLIVQIAENWSNWSRKDLQRIKIGNSSGKSTDPQSLIWVLTQKILNGSFEEDKEAWQDTINWIAEICKFSDKYKAVGFRCNSGVVLTPDCIYDNQIEKWEHRIKLQLTNLLLDSSAGNIESWLQKSIESLYESLEKVKSNWDSEEKNRLVKEHLANLHDSHGLCLQIERSKLNY